MVGYYISGINIQEIIRNSMFPFVYIIWACARGIVAYSCITYTQVTDLKQNLDNWRKQEWFYKLGTGGQFFDLA